MVDVNLTPFFEQSEPLSMRHYVNDVSSYMLAEAMSNINDNAIAAGFSKDNIQAMIRPIYDTSINMIQLSESTISALNQLGESNIANLFYNNAVHFMEINESTLARTLQSLLDFHSAGTTVDDFILSTHYGEIFDEDLLNAFLNMGGALSNFSALPETGDPTLTDTMHELQSKIQGLMYGSALKAQADKAPVDAPRSSSHSA